MPSRMMRRMAVSRPSEARLRIRSACSGESTARVVRPSSRFVTAAESTGPEAALQSIPAENSIKSGQPRADLAIALCLLEFEVAFSKLILNRLAMLDGRLIKQREAVELVASRPKCDS